MPRQEGESVEIEHLEDMTDSIEVSAHVPGTAKTFGYLALEVLDAQLKSERGDFELQSARNGRRRRSAFG